MSAKILDMVADFALSCAINPNPEIYRAKFAAIKDALARPAPEQELKCDCGRVWKHTPYGWGVRADTLEQSAPLIGCVQHDCAECQARMAQPNLNEIEQYRMQMTGICTAALGYWKDGDSIHPDYDTPALRDVAKLYAKYDALYKAAQPAKPLTDKQADMFWNSDDAERQHGSIEEFLNEEICQGDLDVGAVLTIWRAKRLPDVCIKVISIDEENCEAEYEVVAAAHNIKEQT